MIILNKDASQPQHFHAENLYEYVQSPGPLVDVSPEHALEFLPTPYDYTLRPGQVIVLVTKTKPQT